MSAGDNALIEKMDQLGAEEGSRIHTADAISSSPILEQTSGADDELPSSIHPDFAVRTGNVLLVTDDDVGFFVDRSFLSSHPEFFRDFEEMASVVGRGSVSNIGTRVVRRDLPGALSNG
ncbi:hypothetical protein L202_05135 [Cryptococcus amylolentus CBS 6039]|uniref:Uncharacterized protein n=2 Tax=Cryptococcus amylolentus TaxID=104669 RepID=A0A1E3HNZ3_9TREE|nr:hypothetical protein L202_05135 [Cryptococcus amylolentus CBS 6039]ODN78054.1 hypothetical protein L202_05135 [Cryptococcus amylolentus CBS 6039]ODO06002.1 hypothetical protein I350_05063 [Cryptococcus amylolentus CBS 6273]